MYMYLYRYMYRYRYMYMNRYTYTARCHLELGISPPPYMEGSKHASAPYIHGGAMDQ